MKQWLLAAGLAMLAVVSSFPADAQTPQTSPRPVPRPVSALVQPVDPPAVALPADIAQVLPAPAPGLLLPPEVETAVARALEAAGGAGGAATPGAGEAASLAPVSADAITVRSPEPADIRPVFRPSEDERRLAFLRALRPHPRPVPVVQASVPLPVAVARAPRPERRPANFARIVRVAASGMAQATAPARALSRRGSVCGVPEIRGQALAPIPAKLAGCGQQAPVKVTEVAGVKLTTPATIDCPTAKALNTWVKTGAKPAVGRLGGGIAAVKVIASYACRTRNNQPGAKISEHGKGHAVDIAGVVLKNGVTLTVLNDWSGPNASVMRAMHKAACGPFGTVLGPSANRYHRDHFHFDTARYRSGSYCR